MRSTLLRPCVIESRGLAWAVLRRALRWPQCALLPAFVAFVQSGTYRVVAALVAAAATLSAARVVHRIRGVAAHLPVLRVAYPLVGPSATFAPLLAASTVTPVAGVRFDGWLMTLVAAMLVALGSEHARHAGSSPHPLRIAFVGNANTADHLVHDLERAHIRSCVLAGRIAADGDARRAGDRAPVIGELGSLREALVDGHIDLLVLGGAVARLAVFDELAETCLDLPIRLSELADFYENVFGHVPTAEINAAWFAHLVDVDARHPSPRVKRALDVTLAVLIGLATLPLLGVLALLVRLDGGPAIFAQHRIGEGGRPFRLYKLRTMHVSTDVTAAWTERDDPRTTRLGRVLRRWHIDELPQLWNVLRGEMSCVGPRPEQRQFVEQLEQALPYYRRRHLTRPGLTGWAQVRCGYAGSETGAAWKLCNDLYYVKHRSLGLDVLVLAETAGLLVFGSTAGAMPEAMGYVGARPAPQPDLAGRVTEAPGAGESPVVAIGAAASERTPDGG